MQGIAGVYDSFHPTQIITPSIRISFANYNIIHEIKHILYIPLILHPPFISFTSDHHLFASEPTSHGIEAEPGANGGCVSNVDTSPSSIGRVLFCFFL